MGRLGNRAIHVVCFRTKTTLDCLIRRSLVRRTSAVDQNGIEAACATSFYNAKKPALGSGRLLFARPSNTLRCKMEPLFHTNRFGLAGRTRKCRKRHTCMGRLGNRAIHVLRFRAKYALSHLGLILGLPSGPRPSKNDHSPARCETFLMLFFLGLLSHILLYVGSSFSSRWATSAPS